MMPGNSLVTELSKRQRSGKGENKSRNNGLLSICNPLTVKSAPCWTRTSDLRIRSPLLYPAELRALDEGIHCTAMPQRRAILPLLSFPGKQFPSKPGGPSPLPNASQSPRFTPRARVDQLGKLSRWLRRFDDGSRRRVPLRSLKVGRQACAKDWLALPSGRRLLRTGNRRRRNLLQGWFRLGSRWSLHRSRSDRRSVSRVRPPG